MNEYDVKRLGLIFAIQAEIEGMKAQNQHYNGSDCSRLHAEDDFLAKAEELRFVSHCHDCQL